MNPVSKKAKAKDGIVEEIKIVFVDGEKVREKEIDFCLGGHHERYSFIPKNEIWLEDVHDSTLDFTCDLIHELVERQLMKNLKYSYDAAHDMANIIEKAIRKNKLSKRAAVEKSSIGIGVTTSARIYWRRYYSQHNMPNLAIMPNKVLNDTLAGDFKSAKPIHRFKLKDGSVGEFRKSSAFYYLAKYSSGSYVILTIQSAIKEVPTEISKHRMDQKYLEGK